MKHRGAPRRAGSGGPIADLVARLQPASPLADVQRVWRQAVGEGVAARAQPTAMREGVVTVTCESAVWAHELTLMRAELVASIDGLIGPGAVRELRCGVAPPGSWVKPT